MTVLKQAFSFILPVTVLVIIPSAIEDNLRVQVDLIFLAGAVLAAGGLGLLALTSTMIIRIGKGTLAPWAPTTALVVRGVYAHVRNPMITGVMFALLGESLIFHSIRILFWLATFFIINNVYFSVYEEPGLARRFGDEYHEYKRNVPRWLLRVKPWQPPDKPHSRV